MAILTLLTDFGTADSYVAEMKAVVLATAPGTTLVDLTHQVPPGDIGAAAYLLGRAWRWFPSGTVHLAVVDPGVGSGRRAVALEADGHFFTGPDNGIVTRVIDNAHWHGVVLEAEPAASPTFHGRDLFAPAAARLLAGTPIGDLGAPFLDPVLLDCPFPVRAEARTTGEIIYVDRFGNLVSNIRPEHLPPGPVVHVGHHRVGPLRHTFRDVGPGEPVAFVGSGGEVEIAIRDGSASQALGAGVGTPIDVVAGREHTDAHRG